MTRTNRDEFGATKARILQERAGNRCSNPDCRRLTSGPNAHEYKSTRVGVAAHITAAAPEGPRFDPSLSSEERSSIKNGIWLCQYCSRLVDADYGRYPVSALYQWKQVAEESAQGEIEGKIQSVNLLPEAEEKDGWVCPFCKTTADYDQLVCLGCHAEILQGPTSKELEDAFKTGLMAGGVLSLLFFMLLPGWLNSHLNWHVPEAFGLGSYAFGIGAALSIISAAGCVWFEKRRRIAQPPRFFRNTIG